MVGASPSKGKLDKGYCGSNVAADLAWYARTWIGCAAPSNRTVSPAKNNQLRTGADKENPTV